MTATLIPCPACRRHVFITETSCPFCAQALGTQGTGAPRRMPVARMSRAALFALGTLASAPAACGGDTEGSSKDGGNDADTQSGSQGNSTVTTTGGAATATSAGMVTSGGPQPVYGAPATGGAGFGDTSGAGGMVSGAGGMASGAGGMASGAGGMASGAGGTTGAGGSGGTDSAGGAAGEAGANGVGNGAGGTFAQGTGGSGPVPVYGAPPAPNRD